MLPFPRGNPPEPILLYYFWPTTPDTVRPAGQVIFYFSFLGVGAAVWAQHILGQATDVRNTSLPQRQEKTSIPRRAAVAAMRFPRKKPLFFFYKLHQMS